MLGLYQSKFVSRAWRFLAAACVCTAAMSVGNLSYAQKEKPDPAVAKARDQFRQAIAMEAAGDWTGALTLLREVAAVKNTAQVRYNIALCEEHLGQLVAALGEYELAAADAQESGAADVTAVVGPRLESLRARIPKLQVKRGKDATNASISVDGVALGAAMVGKEMPVNPGPHVVEAKASGFKPFKASVEIQEKESKTLLIDLVALPAGAADPGAPVASGKPGDTGVTPKKKTNVIPFVVGGVGAASLIASGVFYGMRASTISDLDGQCGPGRNQCPADAQSTYDSGKTYNTVANVTLIAGGVMLAGGVALYFVLNRPAKSTAAASTTAPFVGLAPTVGGAAVLGRF